MPLTPTYDTCTVHGKFIDLEGRPMRGVVTFVAPFPIAVPGDLVIVQNLPLVIALDRRGEFTVELPATDDPDVQPSGWTYTVTERIAYREPRTYAMHAPAGGTVELALVAPTAPVTPVLTAVETVDGRTGPAVTLTDRYVPRSLIGQPGGVPGLDGAGRIPAAQLPPGAVNAVVSVNGEVGAVILSAADVGADSAGTAAAAVATHTARTTSVHGISDTALLETVTGAAAKIAAHSTGSDAHGDRAYAVTLLLTHESTGNPHPQYLTQAAGDDRYAPIGGGGGQAIGYDQQYITTGDLNPIPATSGQWIPIPGFEISLPAAAGELIEIEPSFMWDPKTGAQILDLAVIVGTSLVRFLSKGGPVPALEGDPSLYPTPGTYRTSGATKSFVVTPDLLDGGTARVVLATKGPGVGILYASETWPYFWAIKNSRTPAAPADL
ncbi:hypothetical protein ACWEN6_13660 [Sphaerisporangium sp. NPDC004334]